MAHAGEMSHHDPPIAVFAALSALIFQDRRWPSERRSPVASEGIAIASSVNYAKRQAKKQSIHFLRIDSRIR
jgi:hypothetical protein